MADSINLTPVKYLLVKWCRWALIPMTFMIVAPACNDRWYCSWWALCYKSATFALPAAAHLCMYYNAPIVKIVRRNGVFTTTITHAKGCRRIDYLLLSRSWFVMICATRRVGIREKCALHCSPRGYYQDDVPVEAPRRAREHLLLQSTSDSARRSWTHCLCDCQSLTFHRDGKSWRSFDARLTLSYANARDAVRQSLAARCLKM